MSRVGGDLLSPGEFCASSLSQQAIITSNFKFIPLCFRGRPNAVGKQNGLTTN